MVRARVARASRGVDVGTWVALVAALSVLAVSLWGAFWTVPVAAVGAFVVLALGNLAVGLLWGYGRRLAYLPRHVAAS